MSNIKKHVDVVNSMDEFTTNHENGVYVSPWIVYVGNDDDGYSVIYSNDEKRANGSVDINVIESLTKRTEKLETEKVFCHEEEYDILVENGFGWVTNIDGTRSEVAFDESKLYCIYEDEGPIKPSEPEEPENPDEPSEPENPEEPLEPEEPSEPEEPENPEEPSEPS